MPRFTVKDIGTGEQIMRASLASALANAIQGCNNDPEADLHGTIERVMDEFIGIPGLRLAEPYS